MDNADYGSHTGELLFPRYHFLQAWLKMDHDTAISVDHMTTFEWRICVQLDWNVNMTTMHVRFFECAHAASMDKIRS